MEKLFICVAPWPNYNDIPGFVGFVNSVSDPCAEIQAKRLVTGMGCRSIKFATEEIAERQCEMARAHMTDETHARIMAESALEVDMSELPSLEDMEEVDNANGTETETDNGSGSDTNNAENQGGADNTLAQTGEQATANDNGTNEANEGQNGANPPDETLSSVPPAEQANDAPSEAASHNDREGAPSESPDSPDVAKTATGLPEVEGSKAKPKTTKKA